MVVSTLKRPIAPAVGFFTQFVVMPIVSRDQPGPNSLVQLAYAIANLLLVPQDMRSFALGLFVTGCAPAGGASNFWTLLLDGNAHLSVTMTFLSMIASLGECSAARCSTPMSISVMMPFWMNLLGYKFLRGYSEQVVMRVPYTKIVASLVGLILPLLVGVLIAWKRPAWAVKARKVRFVLATCFLTVFVYSADLDNDVRLQMLRPFVVFVLVFVIVFGVITNHYMFDIMNWSALIA